jgi:hypothetical protein
VATLSTPAPCLHSRLDAPVYLRLWHLTSLDAPTVAVVWTLAFAWIARIHLPIWLPAVLALAAWSAYIGDRLLDARSPNGSLRTRHHFHWQHRCIFVPIAAAAAIAAVLLVLHSMPTAARARDSVLAVAALAYFTSVHSPWHPPLPRFTLPKELLVGILFTVACATPAWTRAHTERFALLLPVLIFTALAWLNCHAIEAWESQLESRKTKFAPVSQLAIALAAITFSAAAIAAILHSPRPAALLGAAAMSALLLALLDQRKHSLTPIALRAAADLVLLTPLALLILQ